MKRYGLFSLIYGILITLFGIWCICTPSITYMSISIFLGLIITLQGIVHIVTWHDRKLMGLSDNWTLISSILSIVLGLLIMFSNTISNFVSGIILYLIIFWLLLGGICRILRAFKIHNISKEYHISTGIQELDEVAKKYANRWILVLISGIIFTICGILGLISPLTTALAIGTFLGIEFIFAGISMIMLAFA